MTVEKPVISVCMPTYNQGRYLRQAVESLLAQTRQDFELILYDDASTDDPQEIVTTIQDPRVRYFRQERNVGAAANRNSCLGVARGEYIAWLDSDDIATPEWLAQQSSVLDQHPTVGLVHSAYTVIDSDGKQLPDWYLPFSEDTVEAGKEAFRELVLCNYVMQGVMVRKICYERAGKYAPDIGKSSTDWEMWLRIALHADLAYNATALTEYRQHKSSISSTTARNGERLRCDIRTIARIFERERAHIPHARRLERQAKAALGVKALTAFGDVYTLGDRWAAVGLLRATLQLVPQLMWNPQSWLLLLSVGRDDEYGVYRHAKALLNQLYRHLCDTRYARRIEKTATVNLEWEQTLRDIAQTVRQLTPARANVAMVDKYDPTLLHFSRRRGWHFPDRRLLPDGYPPDSETAIAHLEEIRKLGAEYIVFPSAAFWWLDYYEDFRQHLDKCYQRAWGNENCIIYQLS